MSPILSLGEMTAREVQSLDRARTCVVLPVSPVEEHGPHLPLSTDAVEAEAVARRLCGRIEGWTFLFHPTMSIGSDCFHYPGSVNVRPSAVRAVVVDVARSFARHGFQRLLVSSHHGGPRHNLALDAGVRAANRIRPMRALSIAGRLITDLYLGGGLREFCRAHGLEFFDYHAGAFETSEMLVFRPDLVRDGWRNLEPVIRPFETLTLKSALVEARGLGYFGAPALSSPEIGEAFIEFVLARILPDVGRFLEGERVPGMSFKARTLLRLHSIASRIREIFG